MRSPKLTPRMSSAQKYRYYAGYSDAFVEDMLNELGIGPTSLILDPWNGSGTTTTVASDMGFNAVGYDINPAAVLIGRSRLLDRTRSTEFSDIATDICTIASDLPPPPKGADLLQTWFGPTTSTSIRRLERAVYYKLVDSSGDPAGHGRDEELRQSCLASAFYVILFSLVRQLVRRHIPSNPAWIKNPSGPRIGIPKYDLHMAFRATAKQMAVDIEKPRQLRLAERESNGRVWIEVAESSRIPLMTGSVSTVLTSPPYTTRLDYVKATLPELAVLGLTAEETRVLRDKMIGTPTMTEMPDGNHAELFGETVGDFLEQVTRHPSRASATYYRKYYLQYFYGMAQSLAELHRLLEDDGRAVLVVQDSYYKELHVDLPRMIGDMAVGGGWKKWERTDFAVARTMAAINSASRRYRTTFDAVESALILSK